MTEVYLCGNVWQEEGEKQEIWHLPKRIEQNSRWAELNEYAWRAAYAWRLTPGESLSLWYSVDAKIKLLLSKILLFPCGTAVKKISKYDMIIWSDGKA